MGGHWGMILDPQYILHITIHNLIHKNAGKLYFSRKITGVNGDVLLTSEGTPENAIPVYTVFPSNLPSCKLALYP